MVEKDFIDITPKGVDPTATGQAGKEKTVFQDSEWAQIENNPSKLTKEGVDYTIELWKRSVNRHMVLKFITMKNRCKKFAPSGITEDGHIIFGRDKDGDPRWTSEHTGKSVKKEKIPKETK